MVKAMVGGCCVCSDERGWDENPLVYCDGHGCNVAVHQACYGIVQVPKGPWFCRKCESQERIARVKCELCPSKTGALKRTDTGGWAHVVCALYIPEVRFGNVTTMEPIILASVPHERYLKMCYICEERGKESKTAHGCCMNCNKQGCRQTFHVTCAQSCGFLCEENDGQSGPTVKYVGYCQFHWNRRSKGLLDKTPEKDKGKLRLDKDKEKKPKPRTASESSPSSLPKQDNPLKVVANNVPSTSVTDTTVSCTTSTVVVTPTMPKQRGRKPSTVKTLPTNNDASPKTPQSTGVKESPLNSASPKTGPPQPVKESPVSTHANTYIDVTTVTTNSVVSPVQNSKNILSSSQSVAQPTPTPPPVSVPMPKSTAQAKPSAKQGAVKKPPSEVKQPPKKRPSSKSVDEPKRKVGRPLKHKTDSKPRPTASKPAKPRNQSKTKELKRPPMSSPVGISTSSHPVYNNVQNTSSPVPIRDSLPPCGSQSANPYIIPQPRLAGQLENGHRMQEQTNKHTNGPLQLPNSLEQLLEYQWEQGAQFLMQQASQYDVASLMSSLHQLKADNSRLENRLESLLSRRSQLLQVSSRLSAPMSCTPTSTLTTTTDTSNKQPTIKTPITSTNQNTVTKTTNSVGLASVSITGSANSTPKVTPTVLYSTSVENKNSTLKAKNDVGKSSPLKMTLPSSSVTTLSSSQTSTVPKMITQKTVAVQPNQIKITMVQPHVTTSEKDKQKTSTAAPIAILPTAHTLSNQFMQNQQLQVLQAQAKPSQTSQSKNNKQPILLPNQAVTSQTFTTQHFPQQQLVLLMQQQQQQLQQQLQRQVTDQRLSQGQLSTTQSKSASAVHPQKFVPSMQLSYPGSFVTFSDALPGQHIDVSKAAAFATLPLVQLDKAKGLDLDKNGAALPGEKAGKKS